MESSEGHRKAAQARDRRPKLRLHWWAATPLVILFVGVGLGASLQPFEAEDRGGAAARLAGALLGLLAVTVLPAWIVFGLSRSRRAASVVCLICCMALGLVTLNVAARQSAERAANREVMRLFEQAAPERWAQHDRLMEAVIAGEDVQVRQMAMLTQEIALIRRASEKAIGHDKAMLQSLDVTLSEMHRIMSDWGNRGQDLVEAGGVAPETLLTRQSIEERHQLIRVFEQAVQASIGFFTGVEDRLREEAVRRGVPQPLARRFSGGWAANASPHLLVQLRQNDLELISAMRALLDFYHDSWGEWEIDDQGEIIWSDAYPLGQRENELWLRVDELTANEDRLLRTLHGTRQRALGRP